MFKNLILFGLFLLSLDASGNTEQHLYQKVEPKILVGGQSNALSCDWSYFENKTGIKVKNIAISGTHIQGLIDEFPDNLGEFNDMIFVHGESDALEKTNPRTYIDMVNRYQNMLGVSNIYFSSVGYTTDSSIDDDFDAIRNVVEREVNSRTDWVIAYKNAKTFRERGLLIDHIHFTSAGCMEMMDHIMLKLLEDKFRRYFKVHYSKEAH